MQYTNRLENIKRVLVILIREFKIYDATVAKTSLKIASARLSIFSIIREFKILGSSASL